MVKLEINEIKNEQDLNKWLVLESTDLMDYEPTQVVNYVKKHFNGEKSVKIQITEDKVFFIGKTTDGRDYLYNMVYRSEVVIESGDIVCVLSTTEATPENDFEVNLL